MTNEEIKMLVEYNAECSRGIVHTAEYDAKMRILQRQHGETIAKYGIYGGDKYEGHADVTVSWFKQMTPFVNAIMLAGNRRKRA